MTLIIGLTSKETIWLMGDRRLVSKKATSNDYEIKYEDAIKVMELATMEADIALIGYAGLGKTTSGKELSDWMSSVLNGRNVPLEDSLKILANAIKCRLPKYISNFNFKKFDHNVVIPAFHNNHPKLYSIDLSISPKTNVIKFRFTQHVNLKKNGELLLPPRLALAGSGTTYLTSNTKWMRQLLSLTKKSDKGDIDPSVVADELAKINLKVSENMKDKTVGPNSIVVWRNRRQGIHKGGGAHKSYTGDKADNTNSPLIPMIAGGMDVKAISRIFMKHFEGNIEIDYNLMNEEISQIPDFPSEDLY